MMNITQQQVKLGLDVEAPPYSSGSYSGLLCEPTASDLIGFKVKSLVIAETAESSIVQVLLLLLL